MAASQPRALRSAATGLGYVKAEAARALAVTTRERLPALPEVPTVAETLPGYEAYTWNAILAAKGKSDEAVRGLNVALVSALAEPGLSARMEDLGIKVPQPPADPAATDAFVASEIVKWQPILVQAGLKPG